ncbi:Hypothetical predicted protein, partial [Pelobates cultripes]
MEAWETSERHNTVPHTCTSHETPVWAEGTTGPDLQVQATEAVAAKKTRRHTPDPQKARCTTPTGKTLDPTGLQ